MGRCVRLRSQLGGAPADQIWDNLRIKINIAIVTVYNPLNKNPWAHYKCKWTISKKMNKETNTWIQYDETSDKSRLRYRLQNDLPVVFKNTKVTKEQGRMRNGTIHIDQGNADVIIGQLTKLKSDCGLHAKYIDFYPCTKVKKMLLFSEIGIEILKA